MRSTGRGSIVRPVFILVFVLVVTGLVLNILYATVWEQSTASGTSTNRKLQVVVPSFLDSSTAFWLFAAQQQQPQQHLRESNPASYHDNNQSRFMAEPPVSSSTTIATTSHVDAATAVIVQPRAFDPWPIDDVPLPCFPPDGIMTTQKIKVPHNASVSQGFFFLKTYKTASSTSAGVNLRIARNVAARLATSNNNSTNATLSFQTSPPFAYCKARFDHGQPWHKHGATLFGNTTRGSGQRFLWAILRHPTRRAVSQFFHFKVSRQGVVPTDDNFYRAMQQDKKNYYIRSLSLTPFSNTNSKQDNGFAAANQILQDYDFVGVTERIDEVCTVTCRFGVETQLELFHSFSNLREMFIMPVVCGLGDDSPSPLVRCFVFECQIEWRIRWTMYFDSA